MEVRNNGQGVARVPMLFPKLVYLYDEELHAEGKPMREDFKFAVYCQSQTMFPDLLGLTGASVENDANDVYKKYHVATSPMGWVKTAHLKLGEPTNVGCLFNV